MESPPLARYIPQKSKERVFPGSSSSYMDAEVLEIPPPLSWTSKSKSLKQKEVIGPEVICIDMDEDSADVVLIDEKVDRNNKGKEPMADVINGLGNSVDSTKMSSISGLQSSSNSEGFNNGFFNAEDEYMAMHNDELTYYDEYAFIQAHLDGMDIPPGIEASIPWFCDFEQNKKKQATLSSSTYASFGLQSDASAMDLSYRGWSSKPAQSKKNSSSGSSERSQTQQACKEKLSSLGLFPESDQNKKKLPALNIKNNMSEKNFAVSDDAANPTPNKQQGEVKSSFGDYLSLGQPFHNKLRKLAADGSLTNSFPALPAFNLPSGDLIVPGWEDTPLFMTNAYFSIAAPYNPFDPVHNNIPKAELHSSWVQHPIESQKNAATTGGVAVASFASTSSTEKHVEESEILRKLQDFKQFDTVEDHSDHHYSHSGTSMKQPPKAWAKKIQDEWRILEKDLPDTIFVRVYESRMDILRAVIVGAEGTPYHDGLFFFDVFFPANYPNCPPLVHYHSGGLRINPNLYNCGKVCLSLLNTWSGSQNEKWIPGVSTMLQVLVSIQALILNSKPYFNEPGYARMDGSLVGEKNSQKYNEDAFILSLKTMVYTLRRPPKHFEDFIVGHFYKRAQDILVACKAYMDGAQVGCLAKNGVQDVDEGDKSCSQLFKDNLAAFMTPLVQAFTQVGAKDCQKFLSLAERGSKPMPSAPRSLWRKKPV